MSTGNQYSDKQLLGRLKQHCIVLHLSKYTLAYPTWTAYKKRMDKDPVLESKVYELLALSDQWWELQGIDALHDKDFNNVMYAKLTNNKSFTKDHTSIDLETRIERLENEGTRK